MAIKRYISPDSFKETIKDGFRKLMGQYWYKDVSGNLVYGEDLKTLNNPPIGTDPADVTPTVVTFVPENPYEKTRDINIKRRQNPGEPDDGGWLEYGLTTTGDPTNNVFLHFKISGDIDNYPTLQKFSDDLAGIFKNPTVDGIEDWFYEDSFQHFVPLGGQYNVSSKYIFFDEDYENLVSSVNEAVVPNGYIVSLIEYDTDNEGRGVTPLELYDYVNDHVLLYGAIDPATTLQAGGVDPAFSVVDLTGYEASLARPYEDYITEWTKQYVELKSDQTSVLESRGRNIIHSFSSTNLNTVPIDYGKRIDKMPFYIKVETPAELNDEILISYPSSTGGTFDAVALFDDFGGPLPSDVSNLSEIIGPLYSTWASHLISVLDPTTYTDEDNIGKYGFLSRPFYTDGIGATGNLLSSPVVTTDVFDGDDPYALADSVTAFTVESISLSLGETYDPYSSEPSFALDNKMFLDTAGSLENSIVHGLGLDFPTGITDIDFFEHLVSYNQLVHGTTTIAGTTVSMEKVSMTIEEESSVGRTSKEAFENSSGRAASALNQTFAYRISKYRGDSAIGQPVQDFWLPAQAHKGEKGVNLNYTDTQVRYGETYTYDVKAYKYVFGMKYKYNQLSPPKQTTVEKIIDPETLESLGYVITWNGARNLFDMDATGTYVWERVAVRANTESNVPLWHMFGEEWGSGEYDGSDWLEVRDESSLSDLTYDVFRYGNVRFFTVSQFRDLMSRAWIVVPTYNSDDFLDAHFDGAPTELLSWEDIWGVDFDPSWITEDTPVGLRYNPTFLNWVSDPFPGGGAGTVVDPTVQSDILTATRPEDLSITDWVYLFFGYSPFAESGAPGSVFEGGGPRFSFRETPQIVPPSHHIWNQDFYDPASDEMVGGLVAYINENERCGLEGAGTGGIPEIGLMGVTALDISEGIAITEATGYEADYTIQMVPAARIVEVPYYTATGIVLSNPPPPPEISITPYRAVNDQLLFGFDASFTEVEQVPVHIEPEEEELFNHHYIAQGKFPGTPLLFKSDDIPAFFQVYRLDKPPESYTDFAGNKRASVSTLISHPDKTMRTTSNTYLEALQPNIKYYYTFRTEDFHGNVSNPTVVYEIELVDDAGSVYPIVRTYEFPITSDKVSSKTMKKMMQIIPKFEQVTANLEENIIDTAEGIPWEDPNDPPEIRLGSPTLAGEQVWDKRFKIRLTSKKTGKKIDLNVTFESDDERNET